MFAQNVECEFDTELALISSTITHADPYPKFINPKRWLENREIHAKAFSALHQSLEVPEHIKFQFNRGGPVDYEMLYSLVRGPIVAFLSAPGSQRRASITDVAAEVAEKSTQLFCRQSFDLVDPKLNEFSDTSVSIAIIIPFRATPVSDGRLENLRLALLRLAEARERFTNLTVVVVESDSISRYEDEVAASGAIYRFQKDSGPFNKSGAINLGYRSLPTKPQLLCVLDSDAYLDRFFIDICITGSLLRGDCASMPFRDMFFIDILGSSRLRSRCVKGMGPLTGYLTKNSPGGCIWVTSEIFERVGGFDEGFAGWGGEDRDFYNKVAALVPVIRHRGVFLHLFHERAPEIHAWARNGGPWRNNYSKRENPDQEIIHPISLPERPSAIDI